LYYSPDFKPTENGSCYNQDVYYQLNFLKTALRNGAGNDMQEVYPEGFIFINALYGLSWIDVISDLPRENELYQEGIKELSWVIKEVSSQQAKDIFHKELPLEYGAFYKGWVNYLIGKKLLIQKKEDINSEDSKIFKRNCHEISEALKSTNSPYLESYIGQKWPADGIIAVTSLKLYNQIYKSDKYEEQLKDWISNVKLKLDKKTGLIPHSVDAENDAIIEGARGSSQSLILNFIIENTTFSKQQFQSYKDHFLDWRMGMPGIREYPKGNWGRGDIDSGPVLLGIGGAASIVGQRTMAVYNDWGTYKGIRNCIETFGVGITSKKSKKYVFGQLPMADAFIAWSNSIEKSTIKGNDLRNWRLKSQLLSLLLIVFLLYLIKNI